MPEMSWFERGFCRSAPWRWFARERVLPWALQGQALHGDVLELGSGSGSMAAEVLRRFPDVRLTATDFDASMVDSARERLREFGERARVEQADASHLHFPDATFDVVLSFIMLHHVVDWEAALAEAVRVLRPGGRLIGYDLLASTPMRLLHQAERAHHRMMRFGELQRRVLDLPVVATLVPGGGGLVVRFVLRRVDHEVANQRAPASVSRAE